LRRKEISDLIDGSRSAGRLPPEFEALKARYGKHLAKAAYKYLEGFVEAMFEDEEEG